MCHGEDAPTMPRGKGIDIKELQGRQYREGAAIVCALREKADWCLNNNGNRTFEDWERMNKWLLEIADRLVYGLGLTKEDLEVSKANLSFLWDAYESSKKMMETCRLMEKMVEIMQKPEMQSLIDKMGKDKTNKLNN